MKRYIITRNDSLRDIKPDWYAPQWKNIPEVFVDSARPESSYRPETRVKIQYDSDALSILYRVRERYIRCKETRLNGKVHLDSCVEWFLKPSGFAGYFNFEMNCIGTLHVNYIIDPNRDKTGKRKNVKAISNKHLKMIRIKSTMNEVIDPEKTDETTWLLEMRIPFDFFSEVTGLSVKKNDSWYGNLYKCGDGTSHPHWLSWSAVDMLNFHCPRCFGEFIFQKN